MKPILFLIFFGLLGFRLAAQTDSSGYELQRNKINRLLTERSDRFGQYDESLRKHTGIFGFKTKKDMQRSLDILTGIVQTDNTIFKELKVLLDYKDLEKNQAQTQTTQTTDRLGKYMQTIKKLQQENDRLQQEAVKVEIQRTKFINTLIAFIIILLLAAVFLFLKKPVKPE